ncbi:MAG: hypothetical protein MAG715_00194 [Methanonatronarchaeales archaeon]|nr:hypothetical protein [Methanonatronarchaeales archaeon]
MSAGVEVRLREEAERWRKRLETEMEGLSGEDEFVENIEAYYADSKHFEERGMLVESFEALVWAWSWLEIGRRLGTVEG